MINCYKNIIESGIKSAMIWGQVLKEGSQCIFLSVILFESVFRNYKNYYS